MFKAIMPVCLLMLLSLAPQHTHASPLQQVQPLHNQVFSLKVMMSKLRTQIYKLRDIEQLEQQGLLSHRDAQLMHHVLFTKINETQGDILALITKL